jgi:membrane protease YdiL (CAAX protease family)
MVRLAVVFEGGLIVLAWGVGWLLGSPPFEKIFFSWQSLAWGIIATFPPLLGAWWCAHLKWGPFLRIIRELEEKFVPLFLDCSYFELVLISFLAGLGEEAFFRGVIQTALADGLGPWGALVVTSVLFGLGHLITPTYAVLAGLIGLYLGGLLMAYGNLLAVVVAHALYDFLALIYLIGRQTQQAKGNGQ